MTTREKHPWSWFTDKVLPSVFATLAVATITSGIATYRAVALLTSKVETQDREIVKIQARLDSVAANSVTRVELLETMKRVELQLELMMAQAAIREKEQK